MCHRGQGGPKTEKCCLQQKLFLAYAYSFFILGTMSDHFICAYLCWQIDIRESEHSIDWRGRGEKCHKICVYCAISFDISAPMLHHIRHLLLYYFKFISLLKPFPRCNEDPVCRSTCGFRIAICILIYTHWYRNC